jgi:hypothetical protein
MTTAGYWLNKDRLMIYSRLFVAAYALGLMAWLVARIGLADISIATLQNDFAALWSVGHMVLQDRASEAYVPELALAAEAELVPEHEVRLPWFYPPPVFALVAPLAALPFLPAFFLWSGGSLAWPSSCGRAGASPIWHGRYGPWRRPRLPSGCCSPRRDSSGSSGSARPACSQRRS